MVGPESKRVSEEARGRVREAGRILTQKALLLRSVNLRTKEIGSQEKTESQ